MTNRFAVVQPLPLLVLRNSRNLASECGSDTQSATVSVILRSRLVLDRADRSFGTAT